MMSKQEINKIFKVDFFKGKLYWNIVRRWIKIGATAGTQRKDGYCCVTFKGKRYGIHRLIYQAGNGDLTDKDHIDHIDGNPSNNSLSNLRKVTHAQNMRNRKNAHKNSKTGVRGVYERTYNNGKKYWVCEIKKNNKKVFRKEFPQTDYSLEEVAHIIERQRKIHHGQYT